MSNFIQRLLGNLDSADIGAMKRSRNIKGLIKALTYKQNKSVRGWAAEALVELGDPNAIEPLIAAVKQETDELSFNTMMRALRKLNDPRVVDAFVTLLGDPTKRSSAIMAFKELNERKFLDKRVVEPLIKALDIRDSTIVDILGELRDNRSVEPLITILNNAPSPDVRGKIVNALGKIGGDRALEVVISLLDDKSETVRSQVISELRFCLKDARAVEPLIKSVVREALKETGDDCTRYYQCLDAIEPNWKSSEAVKKYVPSLLSATTTRWKAQEFLEVIGWTPSSDTERTLVAIAKNDWSVVIKLGAAAVDVLIVEFKKNLVEISNDQEKGWKNRLQIIASALGEIGDTRAIDPLLDMFSKLKENWIDPKGKGSIMKWGIRLDTWAVIAEALGKLGTPRAFVPILTKLKEYSQEGFPITNYDLADATKLITVLKVILEQFPSEIPKDGIVEASRFQDMIVIDSVKTEYDDSNDPEGWHSRYSNMEKSIDCSSLRKDALQELNRRGIAIK